MASSELGFTGDAVLVGQDGYDGLTAYVVFVDSETVAGVNEMSGAIIPMAMPTAPEPYAGE